MSKERKKLIPELRFPGFVNEGEWEEKKFDELCKFIRGPFGGALKKEIFVKDGYAVYEQSHAIYNNFSSFRYFITEDKFKELKRFSVSPYDIIMSCSGTMGKFAIVPKEAKKGIINQALLKLTIKESYNVNFVKEILELPVNQDKLLSQSAGGAIKNVVEVAQIKEIKLTVPGLKEQQKIASCLSSLDELIAAHTQKLELLKEHKKGLMQNLFPQEGEKVPKYRFPEFVNDGEWEEKKLGEISENLDNKRIPITSTQREKGNIPYYGASGVIDYVKNYIFNEELLCISEDGANLFDRNYPIAFSIFGKTWVNNHAHVLKFENLNTQIIVENYLNSINIEDYLTGMAQPKLNRGKLDIIPVSLPAHPKEQKKIAECLNSLNAIITSQKEKIEQLNIHKQGLMQGLFPKIRL